jgi:hypothetical protein
MPLSLIILLKGESWAYARCFVAAHSGVHQMVEVRIVRVLRIPLAAQGAVFGR